MTRQAILSAVLKRRFLPALLTFSAVVSGALAYLKVAESSYVAKARLAVDSPGVSISELGQNLTRLPNNLAASDPIAAQAEMVSSNRILEYVFQALVNDSAIGDGSSLEGAYDLQKTLSVKIVPATNFLDIVFEGEEPELTAKVVNTIANAMIQLSAEEIRREASSVRVFLEEQVPQQQAELQKVAEIETQYREAAGIVDINAQTASLVNGLATLQDQERVLANQLQAASTQSALLQNVTGFNQPQLAYIATRVGQDEELQELRRAIQEIDQQIAESRSRFLDSQPNVLSLNQQRSDIQKLYDNRLSQLLAGDSVGNISTGNAKASNLLSQDLISRYILSSIDRESLTTQLQTTRRSQQMMQAQLASLPEKRQQLNEIERRRNDLESGLDILQNKLQEARIAEAQLISNVRIVDYANLPTEAASPQTIVILLLATIAGGAFATGIVLLLEVLDRKLHSADDIESETDIPVIGVLPRSPRRVLSDNLASFLDTPNAVEPHRKLLKALELSSEKKHKVLVFTSTRRGEGKSDVVARLGMVAAMLSRRTLIIDADLNGACQHGIFGLSDIPGLTNVVNGQVLFEQAVHSSGFNGLDILSHGGALKRPSIAIESAQMQQLIEQASLKYDLILVDTPPIADCSDALTLSKYADGLVVTVRPNMTGRDDLTEAAMAPRKNGIDVTGIVMNDTQVLTQISNGDVRPFDPRHLPSGEESDLRYLHEGSRSSL